MVYGWVACCVLLVLFLYTSIEAKNTGNFLPYHAVVASVSHSTDILAGFLSSGEPASGW